MEKQLLRQFVVGSVADVPPDFVPLADYGTRVSGKNGTPQYETLLAAWRDRRIAACKVMRTPSDRCGPVYVDKAQAARLLAALKDSKATAEHHAAPIVNTASAADAAGIVGTLRSMLFELRRLADAAETIAARSGDEWKANG